MSDTRFQIASISNIRTTDRIRPTQANTAKKTQSPTLPLWMKSQVIGGLPQQRVVMRKEFLRHAFLMGILMSVVIPEPFMNVLNE